MNPIIKNIIAIIIGLILGSAVNMGLIMISGSIIPPPEGSDNTTMEGLKASMHLFEPKHYIFPFLAHALGTLVGSIMAAILAATHKMKFAIGIGAFFLIGGIANAFLLPAPTWFIALDVLLAYIPMSYLGGQFITKKI